MDLPIGAGKGVIRTIFCNEYGTDYLPVDIAVNGNIALPHGILFTLRTKNVFLICRVMPRLK